MGAIQLSKSLVEGRERRKLYSSKSQQEELDDAEERGATEPGMMMRLANGIETAQNERLDVSAHAVAPPKVSYLAGNGLSGGSQANGALVAD